MQNEQQLDCALDLMRRLPPQQVPNLCEELLSSVDQPLKIAHDKLSGKHYLLCDYNRDGDSYRSPWSNKYDPPLEDGTIPSEKLRRLEQEANAAFDQYRDMYFEAASPPSTCGTWTRDSPASFSSRSPGRIEKDQGLLGLDPRGGGE
ncbi:putative F-actin-capping protein subunit beta [Hypsibius exemplaris]|uniref:F-actin-capping protein subunit beta n=1 Tax=Hypsibius exemplaris TaxID=2072580 RepID=A0A9X6NN34_HYPEX|nr:putative F-actin-capping protein subunit beta [Hypsibius exemplaris]